MAGVAVAILLGGEVVAKLLLDGRGDYAACLRTEKKGSVQADRLRSVRLRGQGLPSTLLVASMQTSRGRRLIRRHRIETYGVHHLDFVHPACRAVGGCADSEIGRMYVAESDPPEHVDSLTGGRCVCPRLSMLAASGSSPELPDVCRLAHAVRSTVLSVANGLAIPRNGNPALPLKLRICVFARLDQSMDSHSRLVVPEGSLENLAMYHKHRRQYANRKGARRRGGNVRAPSRGRASTNFGRCGRIVRRQFVVTSAPERT